MLYDTPNPHGGDLYEIPDFLDFSANTNPFGTPQPVKDAVCECLGRLDRYPDPYCRDLRQAIAGREEISPRWILCGNGAAELIFSYCAALRPKKVMELAPTFSEYARAAAWSGAAVQRLKLKPERNFLADASLPEAVLREKPDVLFLCNPNNPTGRLLPPALLEETLRLTAGLNIRMFVDECFLDLSGGKSLLPMLEEAPHVFLLRAFTKSYGMAGLRLGYGLSADSGLLRQMSEQVQPWNVSAPAQAAGIAALEQEAFLIKTREMIACQRAVVSRELKRMGLRVCPSACNFLLFQGPKWLGEALRSRKILLRDCSGFEGLEPGWYRTALRLPEENQRLLEAVSQILEETPWQKIS